MDLFLLKLKACPCDHDRVQSTRKLIIDIIPASLIDIIDMRSYLDQAKDRFHPIYLCMYFITNRQIAVLCTGCGHTWSTRTVVVWVLHVANSLCVVSLGVVLSWLWWRHPMILTGHHTNAFVTWRASSWSSAPRKSLKSRWEVSSHVPRERGIDTEAPFNIELPGGWLWMHDMSLHYFHGSPM